MSQFYKILKADPLGDPWESHGKQNQTFWCQVEGEELAVSISKQVGNTLTAGQHVYGDLMKAVSQKGTNYWKFKSAMVPEGMTRPADTPAQATAQAATGEVYGQGIPGWFLPYGNMIEYIHEQMKKMDADAEPTTIVPGKEPVPEPAKGVEQVGGEPLDEETKATLDGIFSPELEAPEPEGK